MQILLASSLMFCLLEQFFMLMLAHLLLTPLYNIPHLLTSFNVLIPDVYLNSVICNILLSDA